ncbi:hypothetical protein [Dysgonomonas sp. 25]|uniref:hypothetical protein n=1 Tax=Dysgonomonas sp. 25 TaxID=2302933 RepID=UPI0013D68006|nr:hypothetical protein [Dysgonomonas sp. 25]NDV70447.1 hypothetical protein [Dysgonomonas sp. 25]
MERLTKSEQKKLINRIITPFIDNQELKKYNSWEDGYQIRKYNNSIVYQGSFFFSRTEPPCYIENLSINKVEDIILEIGLPKHDLTSYINKEDVFITIRLGYFGKNKLNDRIFEKESDYIDFANSIVQHYNTISQELIEYCTYLPNVLKEMDKLQEEGKTWNNRGTGILYGSLDAYFRGLIISRLCNDNNFHKKLEYMDEKFSTKGYEDWVPYYEKLKQRLDTLEPIYN